MIASNIKKIREEFTWPKIIDQYAECIVSCYNDKYTGYAFAEIKSTDES